MGGATDRSERQKAQSWKAAMAILKAYFKRITNLGPRKEGPNQEQQCYKVSYFHSLASKDIAALPSRLGNQCSVLFLRKNIFPASPSQPAHDGATDTKLWGSPLWFPPHVGRSQSLCHQISHSHPQLLLMGAAGTTCGATHALCPPGCFCFGSLARPARDLKVSKVGQRCSAQASPCPVSPGLRLLGFLPNNLVTG